MKKLSFGVLSLGAILSVANAKGEGALDPNRIVAEVGDEKIALPDVMEIVKKIPSEQRKGMSDDDVLKMVLRNMALQKVIVQQAMKSGVADTPEYKKRLEMLSQGLLQEMFLGAGRKPPSENDLKKEYDLYIKAFKPEEEIRARHILVKTEEEGKDLIEKLKEGKDFAKLAEEKSLDPGSAKAGGDLGFFPRHALVPEVSAVIFDQLKDGEQTKEPVKSAFGYHVIRRESSRKSSPLPFEKAKGGLFVGIQQKQIQDKVREAVSQAKVVLKDAKGDVFSLLPDGQVASEASKEGEGQKAPAEATSGGESFSPESLGFQAGQEIR